MSRIPRILPLVAIALAGVAAVRLIGAGPGLFQGARAWAEEAVAAAEASGETAAPATPASPAACAISPEELARQAGLSPAELRILQNLSERRGQLDARDVDFETQLPLLIAAEAKAQERIDALTALRTEIQGLLGQVSEREQEEVNRLVAVYQAMRPREAARVFVTLDDDVRLPVAAAMRPRSLAAIMAQMEPAAARALTERLASRFGAQRLAAAAADQAEDASAETPPAQPTTEQPRPRTSPPTAPRTPVRRNTPPRPRTPAAETPETPDPAAETENPPERPRVGVD